MSLHKYRSLKENNRLFRKPPLLGPPLSCAKLVRKCPELSILQLTRFTKNSGNMDSGDDITIINDNNDNMYIYMYVCIYIYIYTY